MRMAMSSLLAVAALLSGAACDARIPASPGPGGPPGATLALASTAFEDGGPIPARHTCDGADVSPPLSWSGVPAAAKSLALIVDDPDAPDPAAPKVDWVHWVVYDLPPTTPGLPEGATPLPPGTRLGTTDFGRTGWGGPCPPIGRHRYVFRLYALDVVLPDLGAARRANVEAAMAGHVLAKGERVGTYAREKAGSIPSR